MPTPSRGVQPRRTQAERREQAEQRLLDAALEIVARRGTARMTLAEVGEAAGYSRGLPAHRFGDKAGLIRALAAHIGERFAEQRSAQPQRRPGLDAIRGSVDLYFRRKDRNWTSTRALLVMMTEATMAPSELRDIIAAYNRRALAFFEQQIRVGIDNGEIVPDTDPAITAALLLGALRGVMAQWLIERQFDLDAVRERMLAIVERTLARP